MRYLILAILAASACSSSADGATFHLFGWTRTPEDVAIHAQRMEARSVAAQAKVTMRGMKHAERSGIYQVRTGGAVSAMPMGVYVPAPAAYSVRRSYVPARSYYSRSYFYGY